MPFLTTAFFVTVYLMSLGSEPRRWSMRHNRGRWQRHLIHGRRTACGRGRTFAVGQPPRPFPHRALSPGAATGNNAKSTQVRLANWRRRRRRRGFGCVRRRRRFLEEVVGLHFDGWSFAGGGGRDTDFVVGLSHQSTDSDNRQKIINLQLEI